MQLGLKGMHMRSLLRVLLTTNDSPHVGLLLHLFFRRKVWRVQLVPQYCCSNCFACNALRQRWIAGTGAVLCIRCPKRHCFHSMAEDQRIICVLSIVGSLMWFHIQWRSWPNQSFCERKWWPMSEVTFRNMGPHSFTFAQDLFVSFQQVRSVCSMEPLRLWFRVPNSSFWACYRHVDLASLVF